MEFVEPEDEPSSFREPPLPDDRLWRHPSEVGDAPPSARRTPPRRERSVWMVAGVSALAASLLSTGLILAVTRSERSPSSSAIERQMVRPRSAAASSAGSPVVEIAERVRPSIAQLKTESGDRPGTGSGVIFRSDGHVLTNAHVVEGSSSITLVLANGHELAAELVGSDPETDIAVVKVGGGPYQVATLGSALDLRVGQTAIAIGSPLGLSGGPSVTVGVVSALHREVHRRGSARSLVDMVQTDAPISPGSSGGALLDANGAVVGITTAVASTDAGGEALGFATPIEVARWVADELIRTGKVVHVWLGVDGTDLDGATAAKLDVEGGAMVGKVKVGSPAERGGLAGRDVVVGVDGRPVRSMAELVVALRGHRPGQTVALAVVRDDRRMTLNVVLGERPVTS